MTARGEYYDGQSARATPAEVGLDVHGRFVVKSAAGEQTYASSESRMGDPLGRTRHAIDFPDGSRFETADGSVINAWQRQLQSGRTGRFVHALEGSWRNVLLAICAMATAVAAFYFYGIPAVAKVVADRMPEPVTNAMTDQAYPILEKLLGLRESELPKEKQMAIRRGFEDIARFFGPAPFDLRFRKANCGPNAFALPDGRIILTDSLVKKAENDEEVLAVLAHEAAHVAQRHGLRSVLQSTGIFLLIAALFGDVASATSLGFVLPSVLAESGYSREFERQADAAAAQYLISKGWGVAPLQKILRRITAETGEIEGMSWISSHPETEARVRALALIQERAGSVRRD